MASLKGKVALVTGAGGGIGRAAAVAYARAGAKVVIGNRNEKAGRETADIIKKNGGEAAFQRTDVTKESDIRSLVDFAVKTYGGLDIAFNNSGIEGDLAPIVEATEKNIDEIFAVSTAATVAGKRDQ